MGVLVAKSLLEPLFVLLVSLRFCVGNTGGWEGDQETDGFAMGPCSIDRVHFTELDLADFEASYLGKRPVIIEGLIDATWPARRDSKWGRQELINSVGERTTKVGSGAGIVYSDGESVLSIHLSQYLADMRKNAEATGAARGTSRDPDFSFDVEFLDRCPELLEDFTVPDHFQSFNNKTSLLNGMSWHIMSIGGSRGGLPFHVHGQTWLGLVFGAKRWFVYPPGEGPPPSVESALGGHPLLSSWEWCRTVLPHLEPQHQPMQCTQHGGDLFYLPPNWKHLTVNAGEAIAVGGQEVYLGEKRLKDCLEVLEDHPDDVDALKGAGLALAHRGMDILNAPGGEEEGGDGNDGVDSGEEAWIEAEALLEQSVAMFQRAATLQPGQPSFRLLLAEMLMELGRDSEANAVISQAAKDFSGPSAAGLPSAVPINTVMATQLNLVRFMVGSGMYDEAEGLLQSDALQRADLPEVLAERGAIAAEMGRMREAEDMLLHAMELAPGSETVMGRLEWVQQQLETAAEL
ncbi:unnamed protein product [Chrysoparadoxa australica]